MEDPLFDLAPWPIGGIGSDGTLCRSNRALRTLLGIGDAEVGQTPSDMGPTWVAIVAACREAAESPGTRSLVTVGDRRYVVWVWTLGSDPEGPLGFALATEMGAHLEAERVAGVGHWRWKIPTNELHWSEQIYRIFGVDPARQVATYDAFLERVHPEDRAKVQLAVDEALQGRRPYDIDHRIVRPDGSVLVVSERAEVTFGADGRPIAMLGTVHDVSDRMSIVETLRMSEARFRQVIEAAPDALVLVDRAGTIAMVNGVAEQTFGHTRSTLLGSPIEVLLPSVARETDGSFDATTLARGSDASRKRGLGVVGRRADGSAVPLEIRVSTLSTEEGPLAVAAMRDVSARLDLEAQLRQAQKMEALGRLAAGVAHDFNNLLTVINGYASMLLQEGAVRADHLGDVREIAEAGRRASALTRQLLAYGRKQIMSLGPVDLNTTVRAIARMLTRTLGEDIDVRLVLPEGVPRVLADPIQLEQVVLNLAVNARDAMPRGGTLTVETGTAGPPAGSDEGPEGPVPWATLTVRDSGTGMDAFTLERIFDPFFTTKPEGKGTGLGLATVHGIIQQVGGTISVESTVGEGTAFRIALPGLVDHHEAEGPRPRSAPPADRERRILVVEDDARLSAVIARMLRAAGHEVHLAASAAAAWEVLTTEEAAFDLLIADVAMPGESGTELARRVAARSPELPVLFVSGHEDRVVDVPIAARQGFLAKPFGAAELLAHVGALVRGGEAESG